MDNYTIVSHLYGITTLDYLQYYELGNFTICNKRYLYKNYPQFTETFSNKIDMGSPDKWALIDTYFLIKKNIHAQYLKEAKSIYLDNANSFINSILYCTQMLTPENRYISVSKVGSTDEIGIICNNRISESYMTNEILNPIYCISDELFNKLNNDKKIFDYIDNENLSELEKKIKLAVSWVGQSFRKDNMVESYLNLCIAFETLLCYQREFISESLVSQMTEQAAFLTKTTLDDRKKLISEIKKLYGLRSDIAHRGTATITDENFFDLLKIIKSMIKNILILIKEKDIKTSNDLRNYILDLKFSSKIL